MQVDPDGDIAEADEANNTAPTVTTNVVARPTTDPTVNLGLAISDRPDPVRVRRALTYTLEVTNNGPDTLPPGALISDTLSNKVRFRSAEFTQGSGACVLMRLTDRQVLECRASGAIGVGETVSLKIMVVPRREGRLDNKAYVEGGGQHAGGDPVVAHPNGIPTDTERTKVLSLR